MRLPLISDVLFIATILLFSSCSSIDYPRDKAPRMLIKYDSTPFYIHGPAQANGSDRILPSGSEVQVMRKDFGYSLIELSDGQEGYVANDSLEIAPPTTSLLHKKLKRRSILGTGDNASVLPRFRY